MKVSEMPYIRPNKEALIVELNNLNEQFNKAKSAEEQKTIIDAYTETLNHFSTMQNISYIRFTLNTNDEFYMQEKDYFDSITPELQLAAQACTDSLLSSKYIDELKKFYPPVVFQNLEIERKTINKEILPMLVEENNLVTKYDQLINNVIIEYKGEKYTPSTISKFFSNEDREVRKSATIAFGEEMMKISNELDESFDALVKVRTAIARKLGYENFIELGYYRMCRNCYDKNDVAKFRANVKKYIVPLVSEIKEKIKQKFGWDRINIYDDGRYTDREPKPIGTPTEIFEQGSKMYNELSPITGKLFDRMVADEAIDYMPKKGKWGGGYCTDIYDFKTPFILANFNESSHDIEVLTHEFGHALAFEKGFDLGFNQSSPTYESCEVHSMSMEFLTYPWMEKFFGDNVANFKFSHLSSALAFLSYGTIVDYFQQLVYENPDMTPAERNALWLKLDTEFLPHMTQEDLPFYKEGRRWQRQMHIYETPFYYIDYCFAQFTAFQILSLSQQDYKSAFDKYMKFLYAGGTKTYTELLEYAELKSPFNEQAFKEVCKVVENMLIK
ncbi:MAG: M3 family oligoendopeptidase [Clostridia bacterium]